MKPMHIPKDISHAPGATYQDILDRDRRDIPDIYREDYPRDLGVEPIKASRYTSAEFFRAEVEKVWLKTWQFACREEEIPEAGDTHLFELVNKSVIIVRQRDGSIAAFQNACLHRGRQLVTSEGCKTQFKCPYHGFTWNIDGSFKQNAFKWDFPQIDEAGFSLPEVRLETWGGFIFVNFDADARPLLELLDPIPRHFEHWRIDDCYKAAHVAKIVPANWKVCAEAFLEAHHLATTHPQALSYVPCEAAQYDLLSDHVTRFLTANGVSGSLWPGAALDEEGLIRHMFSVGSRAGRSDDALQLDVGVTARGYAADRSRAALEAATGSDFSQACDADMIDSVAYDFFPNFHLWGGFAQKICYRFRPSGLDHEQTLMEIMLYKLRPADAPRPDPAKLRWLGDDEPWSAATELNYLGAIYDQDQANMIPMQAGLRTLGDGEIQFSRYAEMRCRNLHRMIDRYIARP